MPAARGFLERFRTSGTPGAAAGAGVPADRVAEREAELATLFEKLDAVEAEAAQIRAAGLAEAERLRADATARSRALLAQAERDADAERRQAAAAVAALVEAETAQALVAAHDEAARVRAHAERVGPQVVARALAAVRAELGLAAQGTEQP
jgi:flagellar hook-length control protein FliK